LGAHASLAVEIDWVLSGASQTRASSPAGLEGLYSRRPDLAERVLRLWGPEETLSYPGYLELTILSHHGGRLFSTDSDAYLGALEEMTAGAPADLPLRSETPDDRLRLLRRMEVLRSSPQRRSAYCDLIREVWSEVRPTWEAIGRPAVEAAVEERRALAEKRVEWREFTRYEGFCGDNLEHLVDALGSAGELVAVPAYFTHKGMMVDVPGMVVVGVRTEPAGTEIRARTEMLANRLKAISDPTRLAILSSLAAGPMTVTEIARTFSLSQPTVSNHVKVLREAGVVSSSIDGRSRRISVQPPALEELLEQLRGTIWTPGSPAPAPTGS
jgi:DNA-binding transcriptional ArsR family regulator